MTLPASVPSVFPVSAAGYDCLSVVIHAILITRQQEVELVQELGGRATIITGDFRETSYPFQQLSETLQNETRSHFRKLSQPASLLQPVINFFVTSIFSACGFVPAG